MSKVSKTAQIVAAAFLLGTLLLLFLPAIYMNSGSHGATTAVELGQLDAALKQYKVLYKEYPPNFNDSNAPQEHLQRVFRRNEDTAPNDLDAAEALVFWLQGFTDSPTAPLTDGKRKPLMQFDPTRLFDADGDGFQEYYPPNRKVPYVYFHHDAYKVSNYARSALNGEARAYRSDEPDQEFMNDFSFQIICAGADNHYGRSGSLPSGRGVAPEDWDNLTNFSGGTLKSSYKH